MAVAVILGSAHGVEALGDERVVPERVETSFGDVQLHRLASLPDRYVLYRHGVPHRLLPNQIDYRANAAALKAVGCTSVLVTSSVGVLSTTLPLFEPLLVRDLLMPDNRLPDGSACTMFTRPGPDQGHLVIEEGLFSRALGREVRELCARAGQALEHEVLFAYVGGPRTKTAAENRYFASLGAEVNSMSLGPEVVLLNELELSVAGLVVGHKRSLPGRQEALDADAISRSLLEARRAMERVVLAFLREGPKVPFANRLHRLGRS